MLTLHYAGDFQQHAHSLVTMHTHTWAQVEYIEEGHLILSLQSGEKTVGPGDAIWLGPGVPHGWKALSSVRALTFKFDWPQQSQHTGTWPQVCEKNWPHDAWLSALPRRVLETWHSPDPQNQAGAPHLLQAFVHALLATHVSTVTNASGLATDWDHLLQELRHGTGPMLSLQEMATRLHLSPAHFRRLFAARYGSPPGQYQVACRLEGARALLQFTSRPVAQIAEQVGYADASAFAKAYLRQYGVRPSLTRLGKPL